MNEEFARVESEERKDEQAKNEIKLHFKRSKMKFLQAELEHVLNDVTELEYELKKKF